MGSDRALNAYRLQIPRIGTPHGLQSGDIPFLVENDVILLERAGCLGKLLDVYFEKTNIVGAEPLRSSWASLSIERPPNINLTQPSL